MISQIMVVFVLIFGCFAGCIDIDIAPEIIRAPAPIIHTPTPISYCGYIHYTDAEYDYKYSFIHAKGYEKIDNNIWLRLNTQWKVFENVQEFEIKRC